jgi:TRAP-type C4-dicarboxylate transport system permease small subunit
LAVLLNAGDIAAALSLFGLMALTFVDVVGRNAFSAPVPGGTELTELLMAALIFSMLPSISRRNDHIVIDLLDHWVPLWLRPVQHLFANGLGAVAFAVIAWRVWIEAGKTADYGGITPYLGWPMAPFLYAMAVMAGATAAAFLFAAFACEFRRQ